jgi:hypothetical protein
MRRVLTTILCAGLSAACHGAHDVVTMGAEWQGVPVTRIGSVDDPDQGLTRIGQVVIGPDGLFYVSQPLDRNIRVYDARGGLRRVIGREGEGPGELEGIGSIGLLGDTLYVSDDQLLRVSFFTLDGVFLTSRSWRAGQGLGRGQGASSSGAFNIMYMPTAPQALSSDGTALVIPNSAMPASTERGSGVRRGSFRIPALRIDSQSQVIDTLAWEQHTGANVVLARGGAEFFFQARFFDSPLLKLIPDGSGVVVVDRRAAEGRETSTFRVSATRRVGDTIFSREFTYLPVPTTREVVRSVLERTPIYQNPGSSASASPPGVPEREDALRGGDLVPSMLPPVTYLTVGQDSSIWLRREEAVDSAVWNVLDPSGNAVGSLRLPSGQTVVAAKGDVIAAVELDDLDVPYVIRYRLHRSSSRPPKPPR